MELTMDYKVPNAMRQQFEAISELTDSYCESVLHDEYAQLICKSLDFIGQSPFN